MPPQQALAAAGDPLAPDGVTVVVPRSAVEGFTQAQKQILEYNLRTQRQNNAPLDFPNFVRNGYDMTIVAEGYQVGTLPARRVGTVNAIIAAL